jgi:hypothetical protein
MLKISIDKDSGVKYFAKVRNIFQQTQQNAHFLTIFKKNITFYIENTCLPDAVWETGLCNVPGGVLSADF